MSGEVTNLIAILGVGLALATFMFAMFRMQERRIDQRFDEVNRRIDETSRRVDILHARVERLVEDVAEIKGALTFIRDGLRIRVGEPTE